MVFFNYSTMQMAAKVVYYGPGLCGKTTNLHYIYTHTANDSRGEMVSLETETDRTLFFDLLPIDVGSIAGFNTRIQLYTVPGQVFYNTTRKLVLKGVDGIVFVADSQRAMVQANVESFKNLEENLAEMGMTIDSLPIVLQYNKRDLPEVCTVEEINEALNRGNWPFFEASAIAGEGVFETLKGISKVTLMSLKKRLARPESRPAPRPPAATAAAGATGPAPGSAAAGGAAPAGPPGATGTAGAGAAAGAAGAGAPSAAQTPPPASAPPSSAAPAAGGPAAAGPPPAAPRAPVQPARPMVAAPPVGAAAPPAAVRPGAGAAGAASPSAPQPAAPPRPPAPPAARPPAAAGAHPPTGAAAQTAAAKGAARSVDILSELENLRRQALQPQVSGQPLAARNGRVELSRSVELNLPAADFARARRVLVTLQVQDEQNRVVNTVRDLQVEIKETAQLQKLLLRLNIALNAGE